MMYLLFKMQFSFFNAKLYFFLIDGKLLKMDTEDFTITELKLQKTTIEGRNSYSSLMKLSDSHFVGLTEDKCLKSFVFREVKCGEKEKLICFLCPYCLQPFKHLRDYSSGHINTHLGPSVCGICQ